MRHHRPNLSRFVRRMAACGVASLLLVGCKSNNRYDLLEAEIRTRTPAPLDTAAQGCARAEHVWRDLETGDRGPASYCAGCLRLRLPTLRGGRSGRSVETILRRPSQPGTTEHAERQAVSMR